MNSDCFNFNPAVQGLLKACHTLYPRHDKAQEGSRVRKIKVSERADNSKRPKVQRGRAGFSHPQTLKSTLLGVECMILSPQNSHVQILTPKVMPVGGGAFGKALGDEGRALRMGLVPLEGDTSHLAFFCFHSYEDTARR